MAKRLILLLSIAIVGGFLAGFHSWRQIAAVPTWYRTQKPYQYSEINQMEGTVKQQLYQPLSTGNNLTIQLSNEDVNQILLDRVTKNSQNSNLLKFAKSIRANLQNNSLEIGGIFNPSEISAESLDELPKNMLEKTLKTFPQLKNLSFYIGLVGQPKIENGQIKFDTNSKLKIGKLSFAIATVAKKFGISTQELQQYLDLEVAKLNIQDIKIDDDTMTVEIAQ
jgi:hypothetical protein